MLLEGFYTLNKIEQLKDQEFEAFIHLNKDHDIFKGHFPGNPVTPGVCMLQILKEITAQIVEQKLVMKSSSNIKFMALINPEKTPDLRLNIVIKTDAEGEVHVKNVCYFDDTVALKMGVKYSIK
ncbi:3-hydroxyacyl-ACP dehydratase [Brumimicrobium sp.]|uniref:3-hydroxyacyl-ACP dehydratase n=1 Tax=Brumimicrobium sp. TaxID=2029867 RepID=UPI002604D8A5|nr:3-hydroxyacyl-ACP dehydratase [uncultured Brumimicrobium sp.]